jgi:hypothetical protein
MWDVVTPSVVVTHVPRGTFSNHIRGSVCSSGAPSLAYLWSWTLLEKTQILQVLKKFPAFYGTKSALPCSQEPSTGPYPEPDQSSPYHPILTVSYLMAFPPISYMHSSSPPCPARLILLDSIILIILGEGHKLELHLSLINNFIILLPSACIGGRIFNKIFKCILR